MVCLKSENGKLTWKIEHWTERFKIACSAEFVRPAFRMPRWYIPVKRNKDWYLDVSDSSGSLVIPGTKSQADWIADMIHELV